MGDDEAYIVGIKVKLRNGEDIWFEIDGAGSIVGISYGDEVSMFASTTYASFF